MEVKLVDVNRNPIGEKKLPNGLPFQEAIEELVSQLDWRFVNPLDRSISLFGVEVDGVSLNPDEAPELTGDMAVTLLGLRHID